MEQAAYSPPRLQVKNLSLGYGKGRKAYEIARNISFSLQPSSLAAVVGVNGIGKSTLLRTLCGMQPALGGSIELEGQNLNSIGNTELAKTISVVLTDPVVSKNLNVAELVSLGRQPYTNWLGFMGREDRIKVEEALELTEIMELRKKPCFTLSDGQLQRVMIARALAQNTPVLILDEPTTHLDLYHKVKILKLLRQISRETNKTVLFSTHEIDLAIQLSDQMVIMEKDISYVGSPCTLIEEKKFEHLFPSDALQFDAKTGSFKVNK